MPWINHPNVFLENVLIVSLNFKGDFHSSLLLSSQTIASLYLHRSNALCETVSNYCHIKNVVM